MRTMFHPQDSLDIDEQALSSAKKIPNTPDTVHNTPISSFDFKNEAINKRKFDYSPPPAESTNRTLGSNLQKTTSIKMKVISKRPLNVRQLEPDTVSVNLKTSTPSISNSNSIQKNFSTLKFPSLKTKNKKIEIDSNPRKPLNLTIEIATTPQDHQYEQLSNFSALPSVSGASIFERNLSNNVLQFVNSINEEDISGIAAQLVRNRKEKKNNKKQQSTNNLRNNLNTNEDIDADKKSLCKSFTSTLTSLNTLSIDTTLQSKSIEVNQNKNITLNEDASIEESYEFFYETIAKRERRFNRYSSRLKALSRQLPQAPRLVLSSLVEEISTILKIESQALPILSGIDSAIKRLNVCILPFIVQTNTTQILTPRIRSSGGFCIPKTLVESLNQQSQKYVSLLEELIDAVSSCLQRTLNIKITLNDIYKNTRSNISTCCTINEQQKKSANSPYDDLTESEQEESGGDDDDDEIYDEEKQKKEQDKIQISSSISIEHMMLVPRAIEVLRYLELELLKKEKELSLVVSNSKKYLNDVHGCATRAMRIQNYVKCSPHKQSTTSAENSERNQRNEVSFLSPNSKAYSSELLVLESQRLSSLLSKGPYNLYALV